MADVDLRLLRYFIAVCEEGGFSRAARRLGMTQPALSRAVRSLEAAVGVELVVRTAQSVEITEAGMLLVEETRELDERALAAVERVRTASRAEPSLRVTAQSYDAPLAAELLAAPGSSGRAAPEVSITVVAQCPGLQIGALREGRVDVAFLRGPYAPRSLDRELLWREPRVALLSSAHPLAGRERVHVDELGRDPVAVWPQMTPQEQEHWAGADHDGHAWLRGPEVTSASDVVAVVRLGQAIAFVPVSSLPPAAGLPGIEVRPVDGISPSELHLAWRADSTSMRVAAFVGHVTDVAATRVTADGFRAAVPVS